MFSEAIRINKEILKSQKEMIERNARLISEIEQHNAKMRQTSSDIDAALKELGL